MYDDIRLHYGPAVTSQLFWLAPLSDEILDVVTSKVISLLFEDRGKAVSLQEDQIIPSLENAHLLHGINKQLP
jgi:hypothetical protein